MRTQSEAHTKCWESELQYSAIACWNPETWDTNICVEKRDVKIISTSTEQGSLPQSVEKFWVNKIRNHMYEGHKTYILEESEEQGDD